MPKIILTELKMYILQTNLFSFYTWEMSQGLNYFSICKKSSTDANQTVNVKAPTV